MAIFSLNGLGARETYQPRVGIRTNLATTPRTTATPNTPVASVEKFAPQPISEGGNFLTELNATPDALLSSAAFYNGSQIYARGTQPTIVGSVSDDEAKAIVNANANLANRITDVSKIPALLTSGAAIAVPEMSVKDVAAGRIPVPRLNPNMLVNVSAIQGPRSGNPVDIAAYTQQVVSRVGVQTAPPSNPLMNAGDSIVPINTNAGNQNPAAVSGSGNPNSAVNIPNGINTAVTPQWCGALDCGTSEMTYVPASQTNPIDSSMVSVMGGASAIETWLKGVWGGVPRWAVLAGVGGGLWWMSKGRKGSHKRSRFE